MSVSVPYISCPREQVDDFCPICRKDTKSDNNKTWVAHLHPKKNELIHCIHTVCVLYTQENNVNKCVFNDVDIDGDSLYQLLSAKEKVVYNLYEYADAAGKVAGIASGVGLLWMTTKLSITAQLSAGIGMASAWGGMLGVAAFSIAAPVVTIGGGALVSVAIGQTVNYVSKTTITTVARDWLDI